jgi:CubicO group peptidase (beta-lactamase class C family)
MAMYLNGGNYGGQQYIDSTTIATFTRLQLKPQQNRRGLGFDKPETRRDKESPVGKKTPASSYGHTGFTGTIAWNDPDHRLIYIFLSNRTYPNEFDNTLSRENIRTNIQEVIYDALTELRMNLK